MIGNSRLPGIATSPEQRARELENQVVNTLEATLAWATDACIAGEYTETLLPNLLWAIDAAVAALATVERHLQAVA